MSSSAGVRRPRGSAAGLVLVLVTALAAVALALPGAALAAKGGGSGVKVVATTSTNAIGGAVPTVPGGAAVTTTTQPQVVATTAGSGSSSGISGGEAIAIAVVALAIIAGIGYAIMRDARRRTPKGPVKDSIDRTPGSQRPPKGRKVSAAERKRRKRGRAPRRR